MNDKLLKQRGTSSVSFGSLERADNGGRMASKLPTFLTTVSNLLSGHPVCFTNSLLVILSAVGEEFFKSVAFECPKEHELAKQYTLLFTFAPMGVLFICGMTLNPRLWRVFHGCHHRDQNSSLQWSDMWRPFFYYFFHSLLSPSVWLFVSLLQGSAYICFFSEGPGIPKDISLLKAESQTFGWIWILIVVGVGSAVTCYKRCCDKKTFLELRYSEVYNRVEEAELEKKMNERATVVSGVYLKDLFSLALPTKATWDSAALPDSEQEYFSSIQKWYAEGRGKNSKSPNQVVSEMESVQATQSSGAVQQPNATPAGNSGAVQQPNVTPAGNSGAVQQPNVTPAGNSGAV